MIPKNRYVISHGTKFVTKELLDYYLCDTEKSSFYEFMRGKTCVILDSGIIGYYPCDYEAWVRDFIQHQLRTRRPEPINKKETPSPDFVIVEGNVLIVFLVCL